MNEITADAFAAEIEKIASEPSEDEKRRKRRTKILTVGGQLAGGGAVIVTTNPMARLALRHPREFASFARKKPAEAFVATALHLRPAPFVAGSIGGAAAGYGLSKALDRREHRKTAAAYCRSCGKAHAPVCYQCGRKDGDFRSLHGPCGRCAFAKEKRAELAAEAEELRKLAGLGDTFARAGAKAKNFVSSRARWVGEDMGGILRDAGTPVRSLKNAWSHPDNSTFNKALLAVGTYQGARAAMAPTDPEGKGRSRVERAGRLVGGTAAGLLALPHSRGLGGLPAGIAAGMAGEALGGGVGKVVDHFRGYQPPTPPSRNPNARVATAPY